MNNGERKKETLLNTLNDISIRETPTIRALRKYKTSNKWRTTVEKKFHEDVIDKNLITHLVPHKEEPRVRFEEAKKRWKLKSKLLRLQTGTVPEGTASLAGGPGCGPNSVRWSPADLSKSSEGKIHGRGRNAEKAKRVLFFPALVDINCHFSQTSGLAVARSRKGESSDAPRPRREERKYWDNSYESAGR